MCAQDGHVMLLAVGELEVGGSSAAVEQQEPLLPGQQQKVRLLACCTFMLLLQWQGSAWGVDRAAQRRRQQAASVGAGTGGKFLEGRSIA